MTLAPLVQPSSRCGAPDVKATVLRFPAADGTQLDGVLVGSGPAGVVLLHQHPDDLCGFWPYTVYLSKRGLQVLAIDLRCYGESACPQADDGKSRVVDDVAGAVAALRAHGAKRIALVGASMGGDDGAAGRCRLTPTGRRRGEPVDRQVRPLHDPRRLQAAGHLQRGQAARRPGPARGGAGRPERPGRAGPGAVSDGPSEGQAARDPGRFFHRPARLGPSRRYQRSQLHALRRQGRQLRQRSHPKASGGDPESMPRRSPPAATNRNRACRRAAPSHGPRPRPAPPAAWRGPEWPDRAGASCPR
jgi:hypothetical protein